MGSQGSPTGSQESHRGARSTLPPGVRVLYVVALATFDLATARAGASRGVGKRRR